ncbi:hypothetical protein I7I50_02325 [Histoplasma capsulatum G186AR]|uniref:Uncharacterized protein n=1 Tax=Ajellomyces capsulatus TaxID=5037 RepID=A0A8H7Z5Q9_AJECA|nr:hypothetical protein I7I52_01011 [Histoplasma capsulatum]QSS71482.1 hypothetical protein I7I50_02325 [Histoplasma capsulatum G186AR]
MCISMCMIHKNELSSMYCTYICTGLCRKDLGSSLLSRILARKNGNQKIGGKNLMDAAVKCDFVSPKNILYGRSNC